MTVARSIIMDVTPERARRAWSVAERIKRLSDRVVGIGPLGLGLDGILAWVPVAGPVYSLGAGGLLLYEAASVGASRATLARMAVYLAADTASSGVPIIGWAVDTLFPGHLMAARALQKDLEKRFGKAAMSEELGSRPGPMRDVTPAQGGTRQG